MVASDEDAANRAAAGAQLLKDDCEADLAAAIPALETAVAALNTLKGSDVTMLKTLKVGGLANVANKRLNSNVVSL